MTEAAPIPTSPASADLMASVRAIEEALKAGPTPGEWRAEDATHKDDDGYPETPIISPEWSAYIAVAVDFGPNNPTMRDKNANYIAAANPSALRNILALIAARDEEIAALRAELAKEIIADVQTRVERDAALQDAVRLQVEHDKRLRVSIMQGDVIANHIIAMQSAVLERYAGEGLEAAMSWIYNTLRGPGFMPNFEEAEVIPDPTAEGIAQAWFNAKTAEHEVFRAAHPGPVDSARAAIAPAVGSVVKEGM